MSLIKSMIAFVAATPLVFAAALAESSDNGEVTEGSAAPSEPSSPPAGEQGAAASDQEVVTDSKSAAAENKRICKHVANTGSRFGTKVCMTKAQWDQQRRDSQEAAADMQRRNSK